MKTRMQNSVANESNVQTIQHTITLEDLQLIMKKAARLGSLRVVSYMRKEGML